MFDVYRGLKEIAGALRDIAKAMRTPKIVVSIQVSEGRVDMALGEVSRAVKRHAEGQ